MVYIMGDGEKQSVMKLFVYYSGQITKKLFVSLTNKQNVYDEKIPSIDDMSYEKENS